MKYRISDGTLQLIKYELVIEREIDGEIYTQTCTTTSDEGRDEFLSNAPNAVVTEIDNTGYEWLDGMTFTPEQIANGEIEKAIEMGETAYNEMLSLPTQEEINAMLMLEIAELKAGVNNEQNTN